MLRTKPKKMPYGIDYGILFRENQCSHWKDILPSKVRHINIDSYLAGNPVEDKVKEAYDNLDPDEFNHWIASLDTSDSTQNSLKSI